MVRALASREREGGVVPARRLDLAELLDAELPPIPYRVQRLAADGFVTVLAGHGGEGKSWIALALCIGVACGSEPGGLTCSQGTALYIDGENGERLIARRYRAAAGPREHVAIYEAQSLDLATAEHARWVAETIRREGAQLVVLDSLRSLAPRLEENNGDTVAPVMANLRRIARNTGAALVVLHHRPKNTGAAYRGSSVLRDQTDILAVLGRADKDPESRTRRYLHADGARGGKFRIDAEPDDRWLHLRGLGEFVTVEAAEPFTGGPAERSATVAGQLAERIAEALVNHPDGLTRSDLARAIGESPQNGSVRRAIELLAQDGAVVQQGKTWALVGHVAKPAGQAANGLASLATPLRVAGNGQSEPAGLSEPAVLGPFDPWGDAA